MNLFKRVIFDVVILMFVIFGWWHIALVLSIVGLFYFERYFEIIAFGIIYDALFRMIPTTGLSGYLGTAITIVVYSIYSLIKGVIRK